MLQQQAVPRTAMDVLKLLSGQRFLDDFRLVGGTALALYWGHRTSVDIDLFTNTKIPLVELEKKLGELNSSLQISKNPIGLTYSILSVKCDFLIYPYSFMHSPLIENNIRLAHIEDIITLKLGAIANRGARKDFVDLYYILERYSLSELLLLYSKMYNINEHFSLLKSMTYFGDAEDQETPKLLIDQNLTWEKIKKTIIRKVSEGL